MSSNDVDQQTIARLSRSKGISYQELLDQESLPVPEALRDSTNTYLGSEGISTERYLSREFHQLEVEHVWKRTWQMVCRESEIATPGDCHVYDIATLSVLVVRTEQGQLKAYPNACLHRGRQLKNGNGNSRDLRCPFHGFSWSLDGQFKGAPCEWDFPHIDKENFNLPTIQVDTWGGWVFINMDEQAQSLQQYLGVLPAHFERWTPQDTVKVVHIEKIIPCNWKIGWEAFIESYHTVQTHPQIMAYTGDSNSQYDIWGDHISRTITVTGVASPHLDDISAQQTVDTVLGFSALVASGDNPQVPEGQSARDYIASMNYADFSEQFQRDFSEFATHSEVMDSILYSVFPNFAPWAGFLPNLTYRFRPNGDDHSTAIMEIIVLSRYPADIERPSDVPVHKLGADESFASAPELGESLGQLFDQDLKNMEMVQKGLPNLKSGKVNLANYQEVRIRQFQQTLDKYINGDL